MTPKEYRRTIRACIIIASVAALSFDGLPDRYAWWALLVMAVACTISAVTYFKFHSGKTEASDKEVIPVAREADGSGTKLAEALQLCKDFSISQQSDELNSHLQMALERLFREQAAKTYNLHCQLLEHRDRLEMQVTARQTPDSILLRIHTHTPGIPSREATELWMRAYMPRVSSKDIMRLKSSPSIGKVIPFIRKPKLGAA